MPEPLTTRDAIVRTLAEHDWHAADDFDWSRPCRHADHQFSAFCAVCSGDLGLMADALLASGALVDATKLAEDEALVERIWQETIIARNKATVRSVLRGLRAALSAQSERAEVER